MTHEPTTNQKHRETLYKIIFEAETTAGKVFDIFLLFAILASVAAVVLESVQSYQTTYGELFIKVEWYFTILFTIEYVLRLYCVRRPWRYVFSGFGLVDLLAIVPAYVSLFIPGAQSLLAIRSLRLLRVFRVLKLGRFVGEADVLWVALKQSRHKVVVFLGSVFTVVVVVGTVMHLVEGAENGFTSIPRSIYWAIVTMTTVGYGDITPKTPLGQAISSFVMILGYAIIAVPTGIVSVEIAQAARMHSNTITCPSCTKEGHDLDATFCRFCGESLKQN